MHEIKQQLLQKIAVFGALSKGALDFLLQRTDDTLYRTDEFIFSEDDPADAMFIIESGEVAVLKTWQGQRFVLGHLDSGNCFGEMALMDMHPRSASVVALQESLIFRLPATALLELYRYDLEQFTLFQMNLGREVSRRLRESDERMFYWHIGTESLNKLPLYDQPEYRTNTAARRR